MRFGSKTSLGIDIFDDRLHVALLSSGKDGIQLVKSVQAELDEGVMELGNIKDPAALGRAIKKVLKDNGIRNRKAVVSLPAKPVLCQIVDLPEDMPGNLSQFVRTEIKHSPVLSGKEPHYEFCGLGVGGAAGVERLFVAATDHEKVNNLLKAMNLAGIDPVSVELPVLAAIRALHAEKIADRYDADVLAGHVHGTVLTMCMFRKSELDFIRSVDLGEKADDASAFCDRCVEELGAVIQFYDVEVDDTAGGKREITVLVDSPIVSAEDMEFSLQKAFGGLASVCSGSDVYSVTPVVENEAIASAPITVVGLAMRQLGVAGLKISIDLIPPEAEEVKATKRFVLITANLAAAVLLFMIIAGGVVRAQLVKTQTAMEERKKNTLEGEGIEHLLRQQHTMNSMIADLKEKRASVAGIFEDDNISLWAGILDEIRQVTPKTLYITRLAFADGSKIVIEGNALSFKSIHIFGELLGQAKFMESARVIETNKNYEVEGLVAYSIECVLAGRKGATANAE